MIAECEREERIKCTSLLSKIGKLIVFSCLFAVLQFLKYYEKNENLKLDTDSGEKMKKEFSKESFTLKNIVLCLKKVSETLEKLHKTGFSVGGKMQVRDISEIKIVRSCCKDFKKLF